MCGNFVHFLRGGMRCRKYFGNKVLEECGVAFIGVTFGLLSSI